MSFDHIAFQVSDLDSSISFYTQKLGFKFSVKYKDEDEHEEFAILEYGNAHLELIKDLKNEYQKPVIKKPYCPHLAIEINDMESAFNTLKENNINIIKGPQKLKDEETWIYFSDPDNNILEYIQWHKKK
jgi:catechol 2,3-dioxygenase-like lactoylglutathione lyase family enzyme